ncbi:MAG TPA: heavy-metal-associated domain-containing protein [Virgibacillus sp.]|nr:heavy-metal-associated domain-containing protein [Virgibacillus sp.]HLR65524.1 heavy-metal-associated domain-containing protein [Virgibacillus sp.]
MKVVLQIYPFRCAVCAKKIKDRLLQLDGVKSVNVFPKVGKVRIELNQSKVTKERIEKTMLALNLPVLSIKSSRRKERINMT